MPDANNVSSIRDTGMSRTVCICRARYRQSPPKTLIGACNNSTNFWTLQQVTLTMQLICKQVMYFFQVLQHKSYNSRVFLMILFFSERYRVSSNVKLDLSPRNAASSIFYTLISSASILLSLKYDVFCTDRFRQRVARNKIKFCFESPCSGQTA
jgi:hypothetical protein